MARHLCRRPSKRRRVIGASRAAGIPQRCSVCRACQYHTTIGPFFLPAAHGFDPLVAPWTSLAVESILELPPTGRNAAITMSTEDSNRPFEGSGHVNPYDQFLLFGDSITQQAASQEAGFAFAPALQDGMSDGIPARAESAAFLVLLLLANVITICMFCFYPCPGNAFTA